MTTLPLARGRKTGIRLLLAAAVCLILYFLPLFHVVPLKAARQQAAAAAFDAAAFVEKFWGERLLKATDQAVDARALLAALRKDTAAARKQFGRSLGMGGANYYFVKGTGRVVGVKDGLVSLTHAESGAAADVVIDTGPVFGNAIRDGSGLLNVSDFSNTRDFNAISSEINRRVEERVLPRLREKAVVGARVRFVGFAETGEEEGAALPLRLVPILVEIL